MIPLGTDRPSKKTPITTIFLVVLNIVIFLIVSLGLSSGSALAVTLMDVGAFYPGVMTIITHPWTLISYAFLHDPTGLSHVAFNMLFLWVFGGAVEDRLGSLWFAVFYLAGAVAAAFGQMLIDPSPMIGASGAVAATTGAFAALCPRANVRVLFFFSVIEIRGIVLVLIFVALDFLGQLGSTFGTNQGVAYSAHIFGYAFGIGTMVALLGWRVLPRTEFDLFFLMKQAQRRRAMRAALDQSSSPWFKDSSRLSVTTNQTASLMKDPSLSTPRPISDRDAKHALNDASARWSRGEYAAAANAWERFAARAPTHDEASGALLLAAVTHARRLNAAPRAREILVALIAASPAPNAQVLRQAHGLLTELDGTACP
ncbi:MAG: rhomboid family intramembrane serine protease [Phycisphaerales bacterium]|nr:rhomboid family intramembrane serine protease [Phycisphaerales bacterium]